MERRESAKLASGATKFLRSLRSSGNSSPSNSSSFSPSSKQLKKDAAIALKEFHREGISLETQGPVDTVESKSRVLPERSQSFQEKRLLGTIISPKPTPEPSAKSINGKVKHSRAQSFACNNSKTFILPQKLGFQRDKRAISTTPGDPKDRKIKNTAIYSNVNSKDISGISNCLGSNSNPTPTTCETIYENLETLRQQQRKSKDQEKSYYSTPVQQSTPSGHTKNSMTIFEKERRPRRKLMQHSPDAGNYMNLSLLTSSTDSLDSGSVAKSNLSVSHPLLSLSEVQGTKEASAKKPHQMQHKTKAMQQQHDKYYGKGKSNISPSQQHHERTQSSLDSLVNDEAMSMEGCKLRRSISEVPTERGVLGKYYGKEKIDDSKHLHPMTNR